MKGTLSTTADHHPDEQTDRVEVDCFSCLLLVHDTRDDDEGGTDECDLSAVDALGGDDSKRHEEDDCASACP